MQIPSTYRMGDSDYITVPVLKKFCLENGLKVTGNRMDFILQIEEFANENAENLNFVYDWLENVLKMGMKTCLISKIVPISINYECDIEKRINEKFASCPQKRICENYAGKELRLIRYELVKNESDELIGCEFVFLINIVKAKGTYENTGDTISYPVFVDVDLKNGFVVSRAKSSSGLFKVGEEKNMIYSDKKTSAEALMRAAEDCIIKSIDYIREDASLCKNTFKKAIFGILDRYTKTPKVIKDKIQLSEDLCTKFANEVFSRIDIKVHGDNYKDALYDLEIFIEKYASITHEDRSIFMEDRNAYPVKFLVQDSEFTKIQEHTNGEDPLQSKKAFFDSKKVVYTNKKCDTITLCHERKATKYYNDKYFVVSISIEKSSCKVKFMSFVEEGDIQSVLSRIVQEYVV